VGEKTTISVESK